MPTDSPMVQREPVLFGGTITHAQFSLVQRMLLPWWGSMRMTALWVVAGALIFNIGGAEANSDPLVDALTNLLLAAGMIVFIWGLTTVVRYRQWRQVKEIQQGITGSIGDTGLEWDTPMTTAKFRWSKLVKVRQHPDMLLIFYNARCAFYLPKSFFATETAWSEANALALRRLPAKPKRVPR